MNFQSLKTNAMSENIFEKGTFSLARTGSL